MHFSPAGRTMVLILSLAAVPAFATPTHHTGAPHGSLKHTGAHHKGKHGRKAVAQIRGQRVIDPGRATEIQTALIREKYLTGAPSGQWDADTEDAMQHYQADHGWQTKLTPDSRALIKLGLGPNASDASVPPSATHGATDLQTAASGGVNEADTLASAHAIRE